MNSIREFGRVVEKADRVTKTGCVTTRSGGILWLAAMCGMLAAVLPAPAYPTDAADAQPTYSRTLGNHERVVSGNLFSQFNDLDAEGQDGLLLASELQYPSDVSRRISYRGSVALGYEQRGTSYENDYNAYYVPYQMPEEYHGHSFWSGIGLALVNSEGYVYRDDELRSYPEPHLMYRPNGDYRLFVFGVLDWESGKEWRFAATLWYYRADSYRPGERIGLLVTFIIKPDETRQVSDYIRVLDNDIDVVSGNIFSQSPGAGEGRSVRQCRFRGIVSYVDLYVSPDEQERPTNWFQDGESAGSDCTGAHTRFLKIGEFWINHMGNYRFSPIPWGGRVRSSVTAVDGYYTETFDLMLEGDGLRSTVTFKIPVSATPAEDGDGSGYEDGADRTEPEEVIVPNGLAYAGEEYVFDASPLVGDAPGVDYFISVPGWWLSPEESTSKPYDFSGSPPSTSVGHVDDILVTGLDSAGQVVFRGKTGIRVAWRSFEAPATNSPPKFSHPQGLEEYSLRFDRRCSPSVAEAIRDCPVEFLAVRDAFADMDFWLNHQELTVTVAGLPEWLTFDYAFPSDETQLPAGLTAFRNLDLFFGRQGFPLQDDGEEAVVTVTVDDGEYQASGDFRITVIDDALGYVTPDHIPDLVFEVSRGKIDYTFGSPELWDVPKDEEPVSPPRYEATVTGAPFWLSVESAPPDSRTQTQHFVRVSSLLKLSGDTQAAWTDPATGAVRIPQAGESHDITVTWRDEEGIEVTADTFRVSLVNRYDEDAGNSPPMALRTRAVTGLFAGDGHLIREFQAIKHPGSSANDNRPYEAELALFADPDECYVGMYAPSDSAGIETDGFVGSGGDQFRGPGAPPVFTPFRRHNEGEVLEADVRGANRDYFASGKGRYGRRGCDLDDDDWLLIEADWPDWMTLVQPPRRARYYDNSRNMVSGSSFAHAKRLQAMLHLRPRREHVGEHAILVTARDRSGKTATTVLQFEVRELPQAVRGLVDEGVLSEAEARYAGDRWYAPKVFKVGEDVDIKIGFDAHLPGFAGPVPDGVVVDGSFHVAFGDGSLAEWLEYSLTQELLPPWPGRSDVRGGEVSVSFAGIARPVDTAVFFTHRYKSGTAYGGYFELVVRDPDANRPPLVARGLASQGAVASRHFHYLAPADAFEDPEGGRLSYEVSGLPGWLDAAYAGTAGSLVTDYLGNEYYVGGRSKSLRMVFSGTPGVADAGVATVTVTATDDMGASVSTSFDVRVTSPATVNAALAVKSEVRLRLADIQLQWALPEMVCVAAEMVADSGDLTQWTMPWASVVDQFMCLGRQDGSAPYVDLNETLHAPAVRYGGACYDAEWRYQGHDEENIRYSLAAAVEVPCPDLRLELTDIQLRWELPDMVCVSADLVARLDGSGHRRLDDLANWTIPWPTVVGQPECSVGRDGSAPYAEDDNLFAPALRHDGACYTAEWRYQGQDQHHIRYLLASAVPTACPK